MDRTPNTLMKRLAVLEDRHAAGFTLVEVILALVLVGIVAVMTGLLMQQGVLTYLAQENEANLAGQGRLGIERIAREVRSIRSNTASDLPTMTAGTLSFVDLGGNAITYSASGGTATRNGVVLTSATTSTLGFSYFKQDGTTATSAAQVWVIQVDLVLTLSTESQTYRIRVHPRSFT